MNNRMHHIGTVALIVSAVALPFAACANSPSKSGEALFSDSTLGKTGKSCADCHAEGEGLDKSGGKSIWRIRGEKFRTLEGAVNSCITAEMKGDPLVVASPSMKELVGHILLFEKDGDTNYGC